MTNTEIIQAIKAEIDKLYVEYKDKFHQCGDQYHLGLIDGLDMAERVLDTLEKLEKPMNPNEDVFKIWGTTEKEYLAKSMDKVHLEMEIATYLKDWEDDEEIGLHLSTDNGCIPIELEDVRDLARHFAKWGKEQDYREGFLEGAKIQREEDNQLVDTIYQQGIEKGKDEFQEKAIEGHLFRYPPFTNPLISVSGVNPEAFTNGDTKIKLIIIKENEE